ncbi:S1 family peptidase [Streptomyces sp. B1866]|uniref:S1 family peptidase n=1 Tax=Streptomyces sp. B1866 TaxID=3075431 RepID=UPI0028904E78|nr:S1 family peptidase [Streptomyces sp. B1866]MDT3398742.1 S1 family peptidase [Streptomyces sp. B1866]
MPRSHGRGAIAGCALAVTGLLLAVWPVLPASAALGPVPEAPAGAPATASAASRQVPAGVLGALHRDLGLSPEQARARAAGERRAGATAQALRQRLGDSFGGAWVTGRSAALTVATTDGAQQGRIAAAGARPVVVHRSLRDLDAVKKALDVTAVRRGTPPATHAWYVDPRTNSVVVRSADYGQASAFVAASGAGPAGGTVRVEYSAERPHPYVDLRGGDAFYVNDAARCSIAFPVTKDGTNGFVTAGHCGKAGDTTTGSDRATAQGTFQASDFPGTDFAWVATTSSWVPRPLVHGADNTNVTVSGSEVAPVGAAVCRSGSTTGWRCGTIEQQNTTVVYPEGTVTGVTRTDVCAEPGDSGGAFLSGSQAQGVTSGGTGDCDSGGTTYYQPINPVLAAYGLTLATG